MKLKRRLTSLAAEKVDQAWFEFTAHVDALGFDLGDDEYNYLFRHFKAGALSAIKDLGKREEVDAVDEWED